MKRIIPYILGLMLFCSFSSSAQIIVNEVIPPGTVELKNIGNTTVNVANYWLCDFPNYESISNSNVECGDMMMAPGDILVVDNFNFIAANDGELGVYSTNSFGSATAMQSYVEWGSTGHQRSSVAVLAGVWTTGDFVPAFGAGESLEYDGSGNMASDWMAQSQPTICEENGGGTGCMAEGGSIDGGPFEFCVGDGVEDNVSGITLSGNTGGNSQWVVTDEEGNILGLPPMPSVVNFDGAGAGTCLIWHLSYEDGLEGLEMGSNTNDFVGCSSLSNSIAVVRNQPEGGTLEGGPFAFCVGDGIADHVSGITLTGNTGANSQWIVTDDQGNILGLPPMPSDVNFDGVIPGTCLIWHISYEDGIEALEPGANTSELAGCFSLSNSITVIRNQPDGGAIAGGPFEFCVGDGIEDNVSGITLTGNTGANSEWIVTDEQGNILGIPPMPSDVNFDGAGAGTCLIWHISYEEGLEGLEMDLNTNDLNGCFNLSNSIAVVRLSDCTPNCTTEGGMLTGGPFEFCVGDGVEDNVSGITLDGNTGSNAQWVVTDGQGNILGLPPMPSVVNFDGAGAGNCLIYHLSYDDGLEGLEMGMNTSDLVGCFSLSNPITVVRNQPDGGELTTPQGSTYNRVVVANRASSTISVINSDDDSTVGTFDMPNDGQPMYCVFNSSNNTVLVGDYFGSVVAFDAKDFTVTGSAAAGDGVFHMWISPDNQQLWVNNELDKTISVINPTTLENIATIDLPGDLVEFNFKPHDVIVSPDNGAAFVTFLNGMSDDNFVVKYDATTFTEVGRITVGADPHVSVTPENNNLYVASQDADALQIFDRTDLSPVAILTIPNAHGLGMSPNGDYLYIGNISDGGTSAHYTLDLSDNTLVGEPVDAPFAVPHNYAVNNSGDKLYVTHSGGMSTNLSIYNLDPTPTLLSSVSVGNNPFGLVAYSFTEAEVTICAGDDIPDPIDVNLVGNTGSNSAWVITNTNGDILGLPQAPPFDLNGAGAGTCLIWHISYEDGLEGLEMDLNTSDLNGCFDLSNPITVIRNQPEGGMLEGGPFEFCVGDGIEDNVSGITLTGNTGANSQWVVTDEQGNILGLPPMPSVVNFDGAGAGTCLIWHLSYEDGLQGLEMGMNTNDFIGCSNLSNPIPVVRNQPEGGMLEGGPFEFCVGDGIEDNVSGITLNGNTGANSQWIVTDEQGNILGLPPMPSVVNFDDAGAGTCLIWHISYEDGLEGLAMDLNTNDLNGCFNLSNSIAVVRLTGADCNPICPAEGGMLEGGPFEFCVGDGIEDNVSGITLNGNTGANSQWVVTDEQGNILGLPPMPSVVNFDGAGAGTCLIWHLSYEDGLQGLEMGMNTNDFIGCSSLSNPIPVVRNQPEGGMLEGGPFEFCVGDGIEDNVSGITLNGNTGANSQWVVTDEQGNILGLPPMPSVVNFDGAGAGTCLIWHLSYEDGLQGLEMGMNTNDFIGCSSLSNPIAVVRVTGNDCNPTADGADLSLAIAVDNALYNQYEHVLYSISVTNDGPLTATNVAVAAGLPSGMVYSGHETTAGNYNLFVGTWNVESLAPGETATLTLDLFTLVEDLDITNFVQVLSSDQDDPDSTPGNDTDQTPDEDDEAAITITPFANGGNGGLPGMIDLELSIDVDGETYGQYEQVVYTITLTNNGPDDASGIFVSAGLPEGMVYTSHNTSDGDYNLYFENWNVESLASGASATLELELFTLVENVTITNFVQVFAADQTDVDSTPGNDTDQTPDEDDEAAVSISPAASTVIASRANQATTKVTTMAFEQLYPVPAVDQITLQLHSETSASPMAYIVDLQGRLIFSQQLTLVKGTNQQAFDISNLANGMYLLSIVDEEGQRLSRSFTKHGY